MFNIFSHFMMIKFQLWLIQGQTDDGICLHERQNAPLLLTCWEQHFISRPTGPTAWDTFLHIPKMADWPSNVVFSIWEVWLNGELSYIFDLHLHPLSPPRPELQKLNYQLYTVYIWVYQWPIQEITYIYTIRVQTFGGLGRVSPTEFEELFKWNYFYFYCIFLDHFIWTLSSRFRLILIFLFEGFVKQCQFWNRANSF